MKKDYLTATVYLSRRGHTFDYPPSSVQIERLVAKTLHKKPKTKDEAVRLVYEFANGKTTPAREA